MPDLSVAPLRRLVETEATFEMLDGLRARTQAGEFVPSAPRSANSIERGKRISRLEVVGLLECLKADLLATMGASNEQGCRHHG